MRPLIAGLALCFAVVSATADPSTMDVTVKKTQTGRVSVSIGDLRGQAITLPLASALAFLVRWASGPAEASLAPPDLPVTLRGTVYRLDAVRLRLPARGLTVLTQTDTQATVRVETLAAWTVDGPTQGSALLTLEPRDQAWRVVAVALP